MSLDGDKGAYRDWIEAECICIKRKFLSIFRNKFKISKKPAKKSEGTLSGVNLSVNIFLTESFDKESE